MRQKVSIDVLIPIPQNYEDYSAIQERVNSLLNNKVFLEKNIIDESNSLNLKSIQFLKIKKIELDNIKFKELVNDVGNYMISHHYKANFLNALLIFSFMFVSIEEMQTALYNRNVAIKKLKEKRWIGAVTASKLVDILCLKGYLNFSKKGSV